MAVSALALETPGIANAFSISSTAVQPDGEIPTKYTCEGSSTAQERHTGDMDAGVSPPLAWQDPPPGTKAFALVLEDEDAKGWVQWIVYDIPAATRALPEGVARTPTLPDGSKQGRNDLRNTYYQGPCPPKGDEPHRYVFTLYALNELSGLEVGERGVTKGQLMQAINPHILGRVRLVGTYKR